MAKKVNLDLDDLEDDDLEDAAVDEADEAEAEEAEAEEAEAEEAEAEEAEAEEAEADEAEDKGADSAEDSEDREPEEEEEERPRGRNTGLTLALCFLNVAAALAFMFLLVMVFQKRQDWSYAVFMHDLHIMGLPLKEEEEGHSASRAVLPRQKLNSDQIKAVFSLRGGKGTGEFWAVDEAFPHPIRAKHLTPEILKDYFGGLGDVVATLEEEITRLKDKVPKDIEKAAQETATAYKGKDEKTRRQLAAKMLYPLTYDIYQVEKVDRKIKAAKGLELDALLEDAIQRRMLVDILAPCEIFRPGEAKADFLERIADLDTFKLDQLKKRLQKRFDVAIADKFDGSVHQGPDWDTESRHTMEKRQTIGFLLVALAHVQKPDPNQPDKLVPLYPDGTAGAPTLARAQTVLGLYEFAAAAQNLPLAWERLEERVLEAIHIDRQGFDITVKDKDGKDQIVRNQAFIDKHDAEIMRIKELIIEVKKADDRLKDLQDQNKNAKKIFEDRAQHLKEMTKKLIAARTETAKQVAELRELQRQLYQAQTELRDAAERNFRLEEQIRDEERKARGLKDTKGAKTP